jgi:methylenetetrahydrofolate reductase (NADPH)
VVGACYPETHQEASGPQADLENLQRKIDAGVRVLITQLFFDNADYFRFVERARGAGIDVPIIPGIIPISDGPQLTRIAGMCGARIPEPLERGLAALADRPEAVAELGIAVATQQCAELLAGGAPGIHFYTLNRAAPTRAVLTALRIGRPWQSRTLAPARRPEASPAR